MGRKYKGRNREGANENGHVIDYLEERLSYSWMTLEQRQSVQQVYEILCENEELDAD